MRLVLDTNVLVSAIGWEGPPREILASLRTNRHSLIISPDLLSELIRALQYLKLHPAVTDPSLPSILAWLHDPEHIVSGDLHLLELGSFRGIPILTARKCVVKQR